MILKELILHALDEAWPWGKERRFHWKPGDLCVCALLACFGSQIVMAIIVNALLRDPEYWSAHQWPKGLAFILVGLAFLVYGTIPLLPARKPSDVGMVSNEPEPVAPLVPKPWTVILVAFGWAVFFVIGGIKVWTG